MVAIERLKGAEFPLLKNVADGVVPSSDGTIALVALDGEKIVGRMFLMAPAHIEGTWLDESHRKGTLGKRLLDRMEFEARQAGLSAVFAYSDSDSVANYLGRSGYVQVPATVWRKELKCL